MDGDDDTTLPFFVLRLKVERNDDGGGPGVLVENVKGRMTRGVSNDCECLLGESDGRLSTKAVQLEVAIVYR